MNTTARGSLDEEAMADYLGRIVERQAFDQKGLIYGCLLYTSRCV